MISLLSELKNQEEPGSEQEIERFFSKKSLKSVSDSKFKSNINKILFELIIDEIRNST